MTLGVLSPTAVRSGGRQAHPPWQSAVQVRDLLHAALAIERGPPAQLQQACAHGHTRAHAMQALGPRAMAPAPPVRPARTMRDGRTCRARTVLQLYNSTCTFRYYMYL